MSGWSFIDNPSASAQIQFQFVRDQDAPSGGTSRSFLQVIPLSYADVGVYTSTSTTVSGGTTPTQITGFSGTDGTNITLSSNTVTVTGDNKRYLALGSVSVFDAGASTRTQRWCGFREDGAKDDAAKGCMYIRNTNNDRIGTSFLSLYETATASKTFDLFSYRGDGVAAGEGGADADGFTTATAGAHAMVIVELNDSAEVLQSVDSTAEQTLNNANIDITISAASDVAFNDSASFTRSSDTAINIVQAMDALVFINVGHARETVTGYTRWEGEAAFTIGGTTQSPVGIHGNFNRGDVGDGTLGSSYNSIAAFGLSSSDTIGYRHVRTSAGTSTDPTTQPGWVGFNAINLDTLEGSVTITGTIAETQANQTAGIAASNTVGASLNVTVGSDTVTASAAVTIGGSLAETQDSQGLAATGSHEVGASASVTAQDDTISATATNEIGSSLAETQGDDAASAAGNAVTGSSLSEVQDSQTLTATASNAVGATLSATEADDAVSASASVRTDGSASVTQADNTLAASASAITGSQLAETQDNQSLSATAINEVGASLAETADDQTLAASSSAGVEGSLAETQGNQTVSGTGGNEVGSSLAETQADDTASASALSTIDANGAVTAGNDTSAVSGSVANPVSGSVNATELADELTASGVVALPVSGSLSVTEIADQLASSALVQTVGVADQPLSLVVTEKGLSLSVTASNLSLQATLDALDLAST